MELAERLRQKFGLNAALVLEGPDVSASSLFQPLGLLAADYLEETVLSHKPAVSEWDVKMVG